MKRIRSRKRRAKAAVLAVAALGTGCQIFQAGSASVPRLPEMPRASAVLSPGEEVEYLGTRYKYIKRVAPADENGPATAEFLVSSRKDSRIETWSVGGYSMVGGVLVHPEAKEPSATDPKTGQLLLVTFAVLADACRDSPSAMTGEPIVLKEGELRFVKEGVLALRSVSENDFRSFNDDSANIVVVLGGELHECTLREFQARTLGGLSVEMRDVYPALMKGEGEATLVVQPREAAWETAAVVQDQELIAGVPLEWSGARVSVDADKQEDGSVHYSATIADETASSKTPVESGDRVRWGHHAMEIEEASDGSVRVKLARFDAAERAVQARIRPQAVKTTENAATPATETKSMIQTTRMRRGDKVEFWGATFELVAVNDLKRTTTRDDEAEIQVTHDKVFETFRARSGQSDTVTGQNRWWVIHVDKAQSSDGQGNGEATVRLETGVFLKNVEKSEGRPASGGSVM